MQRTIKVTYRDIGSEHTLFVDDDDDASSKRERRLFLGLVAGRIDRGSNGVGEVTYRSRQWYGHGAHVLK